jgi:hypothetical protein
MLRALPGCFCAGEMLDWEAPTGGYLLSACFASGYVAGAARRAGWAFHFTRPANYGEIRKPPEQHQPSRQGLTQE